MRITHNCEQKDYSTKIKISTPVFEKLRKQGDMLVGRIKDSEIINLQNNADIFSAGYILRARLKV